MAQGDIAMQSKRFLAAAPAVLAVTSLVATPTAAAALPVQGSGAHGAVAQIEEAGKAANHRHYRGRYRHGYRYRRGPGVGDVIAGVLIIGALATAAKAATRDDRRYRERGDDYRRDERWDDTSGLDRAAQICVDAVERERRVESVDRADRTASGWVIEGTVSRGDSFTCRIDNRGRIAAIDYGDYRYEDQRDYDDREFDDDYDDQDDDYDRGDYGDEYRGDDEREDRSQDRQWEDDRYAEEWSRIDDGRASGGEATYDTALADPEAVI